MSDSTRRSFLRHTAAASAGAAAWAWAGGINAAGANERLTVGVIGCGGQGTGLAGAFAGVADIAYVCDPDESRRRQAQERVHAMQAVADLRRVLDDKAVDAVVVATPDHWHAPAAILACEAGKHVYVEKPQSYNLRESRLRLGRSLQLDAKTEQVAGDEQANRLLRRAYRHRGHWAVPRGI